MKDVIGHGAIIDNPETAALKQARHFHDLFLMVIIQNGGQVRISKAAWMEAVKYSKIDRKMDPATGDYLFTAVKKEGK